MVVITADGHREPASRSRRQKPRFCIFEYVYFARPDSIGRRPQRLRGAQAHRRRARARKRRSRPTSSCRCPIPARRRRSALPRRPASPSSSASSATTMSGAPSSSRPTRSATWASSSSTTPTARARGQARRAGRRFDRARHHLAEDRADGARRRRQRSAHAHRQPADHALLLLRRRHAGAVEAARLAHVGRGDGATSSGRQPRLPVDRRALPRGRRSRAATTAPPQFCDACFTGDYPTRLTDFERPRQGRAQLSLLADGEASAHSPRMRS